MEPAIFESFPNLCSSICPNSFILRTTLKGLYFIAKAEACFGGSMDDDLNIGIALASLFDFVREINSLLDANTVSKSEAADIGGLMVKFDAVLGVIGKVEVEEALSADIDALVQKREAARKAKNWKEADGIRVQLKVMGIVLEDTAQGVRWHKEKA